jgi:hypothetical protein
MRRINPRHFACASASNPEHPNIENNARRMGAIGG